MLSRREREIIKAAGRRFVGAEVDDRFVQRVADVVACSTIETQRDLRRAIAVFDGRLVGLMTTFRPSRFAAADEQSQLRRIEGLKSSRIGRFRTLYAALQRLCCSCYYSDPQNQAVTGYQGPPEINAPGRGL